MKRRRRIILISIVIFLGIFLAINKNFTVSLLSIVKSKFSKPDLEYVRNNLWEYDKGFRIGDGDLVKFGVDDSVFALKNDTIFYNNKPRAIVTMTNKHFFKMTIMSIDKKEKGFYANE